jgi:hypothetical protein
MGSLEVTALAWAGTLALVAGLFAIDLLMGRRPHAVGLAERGLRRACRSTTCSSSS